jgi:peptide/nickel transport system permease protein
MWASRRSRAVVPGTPPRTEGAQHKLRWWFADAVSFANRNREIAVGSFICGLVVLMGVFAPLIAPFDPELSVGAPVRPPEGRFIMGTDSTGMDIFSRVLYGPRVDLVIALAATALALAVGVPLGLFGGFYAGHRTPAGYGAEALMRLLDLLQAFPVFVLAMVLVGIARPSVITIVGAISFINVPIYIRLVRGEVLVLRRQLYVDAARAHGIPELQVAVRHILPNAMESVLAQASVTIGVSALLAAGLSFVGAGVAPPTPEWGAMIAQGAPEIVSGNWWPATFPGLALAVTVYGFALLAEGIRKYANPRTRQSWSESGQVRVTG